MTFSQSIIVEFLNLIIIDVLIFKLKQSLAKNYDLAKNAVVTSKKYFYTRLFLYLSQYDTYYKLLLLALIQRLTLLKSYVEEISLPKIKYYFKGGLILNHVNLKFSGRIMESNFWWWDVVSDQAIFKPKYSYKVPKRFVSKVCSF